MERLGGDREIAVDVQVVAASNRDLEQMAKAVALLIDSFLALDSLMFLGSSVISCFSMRSREFTVGLERIADVIFLIGLATMMVIGFMLT